MAPLHKLFLLLCLVSFAMALSIPIDDGSKTDVLSDLTQAKPDVKIRVKRQRQRRRFNVIGGLRQPFCDKFGCRQQQSNRRQCRADSRFDRRTGRCRRLRG
ncbi:hypothetical protein JTE90_017435 [Oedothorax gibbosus]|uniref:Uncharacterized protein n=1 Tax=Oedothorax gibbosus TaxID=931172 RepID=A0AAV6TS28_9ARAC|nr:hypothetical protein JTE90_017435 [Oedothorax gibbosus]